MSLLRPGVIKKKKKKKKKKKPTIHVIQICSGITCGRVLNGELYTQRLQKLIYLHSYTDCFMKISVHVTGGSHRVERNLHETVCGQMQII